MNSYEVAVVRLLIKQVWDILQTWDRAVLFFDLTSFFSISLVAEPITVVSRLTMPLVRMKQLLESSHTFIIKSTVHTAYSEATFFELFTNSTVHSICTRTRPHTNAPPPYRAAPRRPGYNA